MIAVDLPSHGNSDTFSDLSLDLYVKVVESLIKELNLTNVILAGHSLGGAIALATFFKTPTKIDALILCATGARLRVSPVIFEAIKNGDFLEYLPVGAFYRKTSREIIDPYIEHSKDITPEVVCMDYSICDSFDVMEKISSIHVPCLILCGHSDILTPVKYSQYFHDKIEKSTLHIIKKAGHMVTLEKVEETNRYIADFIEKI